MRRLALAAAVALAFAGSATTTALSEDTNSKSTPIPPRCTAQAFESFSERVWRLDRWQRGKPRPKALQARRRRLSCAPRPHRRAMKRTWARDRVSYGRYREFRQVAPYPGGGTWWAIPYYIVACESGGSWSAYNPSGAAGPYQLLGWGAPYPADTWREKMANHRIAAGLWDDYGNSPWVCA